MTPSTEARKTRPGLRYRSFVVVRLADSALA